MWIVYYTVTHVDDTNGIVQLHGRSDASFGYGKTATMTNKMIYIMGAVTPASAMENCYEIYKYTHDERLFTSNTGTMAAINVPVIIPPIVPAFTVHDAMISCGINNIDLYDGDTPAERIATDLFGDVYATCTDKSFEELDYEFKTYSDLTQNQGQIRLLPGAECMIKVFIQWVRGERRLGRDPSLIAFPVANAPNLLRRYKAHQQFVKKASTLSDVATPEKFKSETKWADWAPTFLNYLRTMPGRDGVPLKYVCRTSDMSDPTPNNNF
jgi:hypothetical protein